MFIASPPSPTDVPTTFGAEDLESIETHAQSCEFENWNDNESAECDNSEKISKFIDMIPKKGFKINKNEDIKKSRTCRRAMFVLKGLIESLSNSFIQDNDTLFHDMLSDVVDNCSTKDTSTLIQRNLITLYLKTNCNSVAHICSTVLSKSLKLQSVNYEISAIADSIATEETESQIPIHCIYWGKKNLHHLEKTLKS